MTVTVVSIGTATAMNGTGIASIQGSMARETLIATATSVSETGKETVMEGQAGVGETNLVRGALDVMRIEGVEETSLAGPAVAEMRREVAAEVVEGTVATV